jgi:thiamine biosynthesis protein ThiI
METEAVIVVRYGEMFLKSSPVRRKHEKRLKMNIRDGFKKAKIKNFRIERKRLKLEIYVPKSKVKKACEILGKTFGISYFSVSSRLDTSVIKDIQAFVKKNYRKWIPKGNTFAVRGKRTGSQKERYTSMQLAKRVGDVINRKVNLTNPDVEVFVEVKDNTTFLYTEKIKGPGGLPVGTAGKVVCLLSGGIDSAVAAWLMMKRGCMVIMLYADNGNYNSQRMKSKKRVKEICKILQEWSNGWNIPLYSFDNSMNLERFLKKMQPKFTCLFCKRMMYRIANKLAEELDARAIVTGEVLGEVASQTLSNLAVLDKASELPVFRPLIGNDKQENINIAKRIGTYEGSISVRNLCKAVPTLPRTKGRVSEIENIESRLPMKKLVRESVKSVKKLRV